MDLQQYKAISKGLYADIEAVLKKHGLDLGKVNAGVDPVLGEVRLSLRLRDPNHKGADGKPTSEAREAFKVWASSNLHGLKPEWLDREVRQGGKAYRIAGLNSKGTKVHIDRMADGKTFLAPVETIVALMIAKASAA